MELLLLYLKCYWQLLWMEEEPQSHREWGMKIPEWDANKPIGKAVSGCHGHHCKERCTYLPPTVLAGEVCLPGGGDCLWSAIVWTCSEFSGERAGDNKIFYVPVSFSKTWCSGCCDNVHSIRTPLKVGGVTGLRHTRQYSQYTPKVYSTVQWNLSSQNTQRRWCN